MSDEYDRCIVCGKRFKQYTYYIGVRNSIPGAEHMCFECLDALVECMALDGDEFNEGENNDGKQD